MIWLGAYLCGFIVVYSCIPRPWTRATVDDILIPLLFWWAIAFVWIFVPRKWYRPEAIEHEDGN